MAGRYEHFVHGADIGVRGIGPTVEEAFVQAARALTAVMVDPDRVTPREPVAIAASAPDLETLLVDWLNALLFETATRHMLFGRFAVRIAGDRLEATAWGEPIDPLRHQPAVEVKGATMTELAVRRLPDGSWLAQCVVDV
ncbi:MAG: archease [Geminicoccaceae bacterium]|nr:archease [Geminicoccaceae bacterium]MCS7268495.1 archease [Geminicoccaceae bacterium]MCX8102487.1 archease [Geminicoccaceae bacterium]MDW8124385.1 archease [Geminicoccaceae bacterium]